ncbi:MAG: TIGR03756 family integrating conjugative element protein, partial [Dehalococcoidia bacterium]
GSGTGLLCPSATDPMVPYFQSALDSIAWRSGIPESIYYQALTPGVREIGNWPGNTWGNVYPRSGFLAQPEYPKAAAVIAQRAADIVTRTNQPHVYQPIPDNTNTAGMRVWNPNPATEGDRHTASWQMHLPVASTSCGAFGSDDRFSGLAGWASGKGSNQRAYVWTMWRQYQCCQRRGRYLHSVTW